MPESKCNQFQLPCIVPHFTGYHVHFQLFVNFQYWLLCTHHLPLYLSPLLYFLFPCLMPQQRHILAFCPFKYTIWVILLSASDISQISREKKKKNGANGDFGNRHSKTDFSVLSVSSQVWRLVVTSCLLYLILGLLFKFSHQIWQTV